MNLKVGNLIQKKSNDGGIDGWANDGKVAIQIKNHSKKIGRQEIQSFLELFLVNMKKEFL